MLLSPPAAVHNAAGESVKLRSGSGCPAMITYQRCRKILEHCHDVVDRILT